ncbi:hypothetical protein Scep_014660 [Stephania cephalantha]|uniref:Uncharacterized protein n=1 Tax=Stephania cephalantha TaxID=152367 RepID=A0AAP0P0Q2_9MAGN
MGNDCLVIIMSMPFSLSISVIDDPLSFPVRPGALLGRLRCQLWHGHRGTKEKMYLGLRPSRRSPAVYELRLILLRSQFHL